MSTVNPRLIATQVLRRVIHQGESLRQVFINTPKANDPLVRDLCYGSLRWHEPLSALLTHLLAKPLKAKHNDIECLLRLGLYQIIYQQTPDHAAVNETVAVIRGLKKPWAKRLVNGVLRTFLRQRTELLAKVNQQENVRYAFPYWLLKKIKIAYPDHWQAILEASNQRAPMVLRVNLSRTSRAAYCQQLKDANIQATPSSVCETAILLAEPVNVSELPDFDQGVVSIQDTAAQLAAGLLDLKPNLQVLDACSAPGGKTGHILEACNNLTVVAVDSSKVRLQRVKENLDRLSESAILLAVDANAIDQWGKDYQFDRILLDAPCSATGVIRRHPDIKCLRRPEDIKSLQAQQYKLLTNLWAKLKPEGKLLYATCSILPEENEQQIATFVQHTTDVEVQSIKGHWGMALPYGRQIFPNESAMDGFYYALLAKKP